MRNLDVCPCSSVEEQGARFAAPRCGGHCGVFTNTIVPIPHGKYTMCHRGLFDEYVDYYNNVKSKTSMNDLSQKYFKNNNIKSWLYDKEQFRVLHNSMNQFLIPN